MTACIVPDVARKFLGVARAWCNSHDCQDALVIRLAESAGRVILTEGTPPA